MAASHRCVRTGRRQPDKEFAMRKTENTIALLGGALLGAAAMYVLDPDMGKRRRQYIAEQAGDYFDEAGNLVRGGWESVRDRASDMGSTIADRAADYRDRLGDLADDYRSRMADKMADGRDAASAAGGSLRSRGMRLWKRITGRASDYADDYADRADDLRENVADYGNRLWNRVRKIGGRLSDQAGSAVSTARHRIAGEDESSHVLGITATGLGCCVLGCGLMYLMDPRLGRSRRAWLVDKTSSLVRRRGRVPRDVPLVGPVGQRTTAATRPFADRPGRLAPETGAGDGRRQRLRDP
jgi:gas vesicle protein